jgi:hypothetical protein
VSATLDAGNSRDERRRPTDLHIRAVLERLPVAVLRIDVNGTLMAVNQAGLGLLGADSLAQVLGTSFLAYLDDSLVAPCRRLLEDAGEGVGGSLEIDLRGLTGTPHALEVHAVPHPGAPDATPSVMVTLRDVTRARQLAQVLEVAVARQTDADNRLQSALQDLQQQQSRYDALLTERQQAGQQVEAEHADFGQRLTAAAEETTRAVARAGELERALEEAQRGHEDARRAHEEALHAHEEARRANESATNELQARIESLERSHASGLESVRAELGSELSVREAAHAAQCAELSAAHDARLTKLATTHSAQLAETESALAAALAGQHAARTALEQAETAFTDERQRLEAEMAAARDAGRAAQTAWTTEQSERLRAEVARQHLVDAIARLAREAGVVGTGPGDAGGANPMDANRHDVPAPDGHDPKQTSAW